MAYIWQKKVTSNRFFLPSQPVAKPLQKRLAMSDGSRGPPGIPSSFALRGGIGSAEEFIPFLFLKGLSGLPSSGWSERDCRACGTTAFLAREMDPGPPPSVFLFFLLLLPPVTGEEDESARKSLLPLFLDPPFQAGKGEEESGEKAIGAGGRARNDDSKKAALLSLPNFSLRLSCTVCFTAFCRHQHEQGAREGGPSPFLHLPFGQYVTFPAGSSILFEVKK